MALPEGTTATRLGLQDRLEEKIGQLVGVRVCTKDNITAIATITAIRSSLGNKFLTAKAGGAIPSITCLRMNPDSIDEHAVRISEDSGKVPPFSWQSHPSRRVPPHGGVQQHPFW